MNNYYSATLGRVLREWHESQNLTMYAIAKTLQANRQPLDDLESGKSSAPENTLRYLVWAVKRSPHLWQNYIAALDQATSEEEQRRILEYQEQEQKNKEKAEAARKARESEIAKAAVRDEVKAEVISEMSQTIEDIKTALAESQQAAATANQRVEALESAVVNANERAKEASDKVVALTEDNQKQADEINKLKEENDKLVKQASSMRKASLWKRIFGKF